MRLLIQIIAIAMLTTLAAGTAGGQEADYSREGADTCLSCHDDEVTLALFRGAHAVPTDPNGPFGHGQLQCEACHGPGGDHAGRVRRGQERPSITVRFGPGSPTPVEAQNAACMGCHKADMGFGWHGNDHDMNEVACADCHSIANGIWEETPHFHATKTLVKPPERYQVPRHHDPECISCHVVGWDPHGYFPYESGYASLESDEGLHNVGCESCHGPGSQHADAENGDIDATDDELKAYQQEMVLTLEKAEAFCKRCHDLDNSPDFHKPGAFDEYWEKVEHYGKD